MIPGWVRKYIGIPFEWNGDTFHGADCYGLVRLVMRRQFGIYAPEIAVNDPGQEIGPLFASNMRRHQIWIPDAARQFNVIVLKIRGIPMHCGLLVSDHEMLHASQGADSCIERVDSLFWKERHAGYFRHKELPV